MASDSGWIKVSRSILNHWVFTDEIVFKIWMYLLLQANHEDRKIIFDGELFDIKRGQHLTSIRKIAADVKCSRSKVARTLDVMKREQMLESSCFKSGTLLTIVNYGIYQCVEPAKSHQTATKRPPSEPPKSLNKNEKNYKNEKNEKNKTIDASDEAPGDRIKHKYGSYQNVLLKDAEIEKLNADFGEEQTKEAIAYLDEYIEMKGYKAKSHYLAIRKWVFSAIKEKRQREQRTQTQAQTQHGFKQNDIDFDELERRLLAN